MITDAGPGIVGTGALVEQGAKAAVAYQNEYGDGLDGHKIDLYICENQQTPAGGQACANDMVQRGVIAVVLPFTGQGQTEVPTVVKAGIPYITMSGESTTELTTPGSFALQGGFPAILGAVALQAKQKGYKKVAFVVSNVPAVVEGAQAIGDLVFKAAGVGYQVVPVDPGTADITPQLQSAVSSGASALGVVGDVTLCSSFLRAYGTLGLTLPRYVTALCLDPSILNSPSLDKVMQGSWLAGSGTATPKQDALLRRHRPPLRTQGEPEPQRQRQRPGGHAADPLVGRDHEGPLRIDDHRRHRSSPDRVGHRRPAPDVRGRHVHLQRDGHPDPQVRVLVDGGHRRDGQGVCGDPHRGLRPDATVLKPGPRNVRALASRRVSSISPGHGK